MFVKDDKTYPYIKITTNEPFPRIITRKKLNDQARYLALHVLWLQPKTQTIDL